MQSRCAKACIVMDQAWAWIWLFFEKSKVNNLHLIKSTSKWGSFGIDHHADAVGKGQYQQRAQVEERCRQEHELSDKLHYSQGDRRRKEVFQIQTYILNLSRHNLGSEARTSQEDPSLEKQESIASSITQRTNQDIGHSRKVVDNFLAQD